MRKARRKLANASLQAAGKLTGKNLQQVFGHLEQGSFCLTDADWERIRRADVISFDIFDTLILRDVTDPKDLFDLCGLALNIQGFRSARIQAERDARALREDEITLEMIYARLAADLGIDPREGMALECRLEERHCHANPQMKPVFEKVRSLCERTGKKCVIISDMYLPEDVVTGLLGQCGFTGYDRLFLSSACGVRKTDGRLYGLAKKELGEDKRYIHIGDNARSDGERAREQGMETILIPLLSAAGITPEQLLVNPFPGSWYCALVNEKMLSSGRKFDPDYRFGYTYFGILVYGYCQWLHALRVRYGAEAVYFAARDMKVVWKVYQALFPGDVTAYVAASRLAMLKADLPRMSDMFLKNTEEALRGGEEPGQVFERMKAGCLTGLLKENGVDLRDGSEKNQRKILQVLGENRSRMRELFQDEQEAAEAYFDRLPRGKRILFADLNGRGTGAIVTQDLLSRLGTPCEVICALVYTTTQGELFDSRGAAGKICTYLFSMDHDRYHRNVFSFHWESTAAILETVFTEAKGTLLSYAGTGPEGLTYAGFEGDSRRLEQIHQGIEDFAADFHARWGGTGLTDEIAPQLPATVLLAALGAKKRHSGASLVMGR